MISFNIFKYYSGPRIHTNGKKIFVTAGGTGDQNSLIGAAVSYDMASQRCNGGHSSNTGHGAVMGLSIGKIFDF